MADFPPTLPAGEAAWYAGNTTYQLKEHDGDVYAFYQKDLSFGFKHGYQIDVIFLKDRPEKTLAQVKVLSGNSWGKGTWLICDTRYYPTMDRAIAALKGETEIPKGKRKPRPIREMNQEELDAWKEGR